MSQSWLCIAIRCVWLAWWWHFNKKGSWIWGCVFPGPTFCIFYLVGRSVLANWNDTEKQGQEATEQLVLAAHMPDFQPKSIRTTPFSQMTDILSSTPFTPLGILVKSSLPRAFWHTEKVQLSVPVRLRSSLSQLNRNERAKLKDV